MKGLENRTTLKISYTFQLSVKEQVLCLRLETTTICLCTEDQVDTQTDMQFYRRLSVSAMEDTGVCKFSMSLYRAGLVHIDKYIDLVSRCLDLVS